MRFEVDVLVIGAGAAGLMCAIEAGKRGRRVVVLEHNREIGRKILISGGGHCNFTNLHTAPEHFISANPHFAKSALARYRPQDFVALVERHRIPYHEKKLGQLFCDRSARDITQLLEAECAGAGVRIETACTVREVEADPPYVVKTSTGDYFTHSLVIATGGLSVPKTGATAFGYQVARQFGLRIVPCRPALTPLLWDPGDLENFGDLTGVSTDVIASSGESRFREKLLFTHRGISGPAILQVSSYWTPGCPVEIDWLPGVDFLSVLREARTAGAAFPLRTVLSRFLPKRLADRWCELHPLSSPLTALSDRQIDAVTRELHHWTCMPAGTEGYAKAEVTAGGVDTAELSSKTMEARKAPGLYFIGEVVDVTGHLGGFNFQWAWAAGHSAGQSV